MGSIGEAQGDSRESRSVRERKPHCVVKHLSKRASTQRVGRAVRETKEAKESKGQKDGRRDALWGETKYLRK